MTVAKRGRRASSGGRATPNNSLRALADEVGIVAEYVDQTGKEHRKTSDETRVAILAAMGIEAGDAAAATRALEERRTARAARLLPAARVVERHDAELARVRAELPEGWPATVRWSLEVVDESGQVQRSEGQARRSSGGGISVALPEAPGLGYHTIRLTIEGGGQTCESEQQLIVVPANCPRAGERLRGQRVWGVTANLYSLRSRRNWGAGDLGDLRELARWTGEMGGAFVGVNPLHALRNRENDVSPYSPVSRLFRNVLYLDVESIPGFGDSEEARDYVSSGGFLRERERLRMSARLHNDAVTALKRPALESLHRRFLERQRSGDDPRAAWYSRYLEREGEALTLFATYGAIADHLERSSVPSASWREWPAELRDPRSDAVAAFRERHRQAVDFHRWQQFELDCQLADAARVATDGGMPIGLYQDLAIGSAPGGSDAWAYQHLFLQGASIGAPPDPLAADGQNWGLPPIDPARLADDGFRFWISLVRASLRHAGALRMDHVVGLFRQFWIPEGLSGKQGAYVRFPSDDLLGILALESTRSGALVVGEDLGTVPDDVPPALNKWGILGSKVLYFEQDEKTGFRPASTYARESLATANTHDMPTVAGFWRGRDIELRQQVGSISGREAREGRAVRERERTALVRLLADDGLLPDDDEAAVTTERLRAAVHAFMRRTPAWLVGLSLDDLAGETEPVNLPGVGPDKFGSWRRRLAMPLESLFANPDVRRALGYERAWVK